MVDTDDCLLYEVFDAYPDGSGGWDAGSGAVFDLLSHDLRPDGWTSADAAGLAILPGLVRYDEVARTLVHHLKYHDRTDLAPTMGRWMARAGHELLDTADVLVPVPLHWRRAFSRRFNQAGALAKAIGRASGVPVARDALRRVRPTEHQIGLSRAQRATNVQGAFKVPPERRHEIQGRRIVLVDDVLTSGATSDACARALLRAKAAQVDLLVFARVVEVAGGPI